MRLHNRIVNLRLSRGLVLSEGGVIAVPMRAVWNWHGTLYVFVDAVQLGRSRDPLSGIALSDTSNCD